MEVYCTVHSAHCLGAGKAQWPLVRAALTLANVNKGKVCKIVF